MSIVHKIRPNGPRVLVKVLPEADKSKGGIWIPEMAKDRVKTFTTGEVLAVGVGETGLDGKVHPTGFEVGDTVIFAKFGGFNISLDGVDCTLLEAREVLGTVIKTN